MNLNILALLMTAIALFISFMINLFVTGVFAQVKKIICLKKFICKYNRLRQIGKLVSFIQKINISFNCDHFNLFMSRQAFHHGECSKAQLRTAGDCINQRFGKAAKIIWGIGLLSAGQSATMTVCQIILFYVVDIHKQY